MLFTWFSIPSLKPLRWSSCGPHVSPPSRPCVSYSCPKYPSPCVRERESSRQGRRRYPRGVYHTQAQLSQTRLFLRRYMAPPPYNRYPTTRSQLSTAKRPFVDPRVGTNVIECLSSDCSLVTLVHTWWCCQAATHRRCIAFQFRFLVLVREKRLNCGRLCRLDALINLISPG